MISKFLVEDLALLTQDEFYIFIGLVTGFFISLFADLIVDRIFERKNSKRLDVLERIVLDKSKFIINSQSDEKL